MKRIKSQIYSMDRYEIRTYQEIVDGNSKTGIKNRQFCLKIYDMEEKKKIKSAYFHSQKDVAVVKKLTINLIAYILADKDICINHSNKHNLI